MLPALQAIMSLLNGWTPLTQSGAWIVGAGLLIIYLNNSRFAEKKSQAEFNDTRRKDLMEEVIHEQDRRTASDARGDRWRSAARWWNAKAHDERLDRITDRVSIQELLASIPGAPRLVLPNMLPLPRMVEEVAETEGHL